MSAALQRMRHHLLVAAVVVASVVTPGECIVDPSLPNIFYPFGDDVGDTIGPNADDGYTPSITIPGGYPFFGTKNTVVFVSKTTRWPFSLVALLRSTFRF